MTGSGKTEVYFEAVAEALRQGRQGLVLLPEIALTAQFLDRFAARFGARPAEWHSGLTERQRQRVWAAAASGEAQDRRWRAFGVVPAVRRPRPHRRRRGARRRLQAGRRGHLQCARHGGRARKARAGAGRARFRHARARDKGKRRDRTLSLAHGCRARFGEATLPDIATVDLRREGPPRGRWLSPRAIAGVEEARSRGEQALLFLNRRGYAPL